MDKDVMQNRLSHKESGKCLLVAFRSRLTLALVNECSGDKFQMGDRRYRDKGYGDWTGFYDWLKDSDGKILGVRYWPFREIHLPIKKLFQLPYVVVAKDRSYIEIYFSNDHQVDAQCSDDQDFGANKVFLTDQSELAISFRRPRLNIQNLSATLKVIPK